MSPTYLLLYPSLCRTDTFEETSLSWQLSQFQQQPGEWWEYQFYRFERALPELPTGWSISPRLGELLKFLFWLVIALFIVWIGWRSWREFSPYLYSWLKKSGNLTDFRVKTHSSESSIDILLEPREE